MQTRRQAAAAATPDGSPATPLSESDFAPERPPETPPDVDEQLISTSSTSNPVRVLDHIPKGPCTTSWSHYSEVPAECRNREEVCLGVDEAGRGPVLGPMVYAISYVPVARKSDLAEVGFADSKALKEEDRDRLFDALLEKGDFIGWAVHTCSPQDISECMLRRAKYNLNELAHETTIQLIRKTIDSGVRVTQVFVDTVGPPETYQKKLKGIFPGIDITVAKKADSLYPIVSAASICAKVTRDSVLRNWQFAEPGLDGKISQDFGSGYPSDPNTVRWINDNIDPIFGFPRLIRFSWSTCDKLLEDKAVAVKWADDDDESAQGGDIRQMFGTVQQEKSKIPERDCFFTGMGLQHIHKLRNETYNIDETISKTSLHPYTSQILRPTTPPVPHRHAWSSSPSVSPAPGLKAGLVGGDREADVLYPGDKTRPRFLVAMLHHVRAELVELGAENAPPGDPRRLQVYSEIWDYFIEEFKTYKPLLTEIKHEYESLLNNMRQQIDKLGELYMPALRFSPANLMLMTR
ncbi:Ribonuclease H2 subunit A [Rhizophlyctis rosea]|uniref:Ribonuclease n=1 Tax=Rhizophlyctis rosea TaxID=64517 RepID=A0AAD5X6B3_9FUNG|nr:Ribonuclease H2 subunit A [Rhizophlyctis rosea]